LPIGIVFSAALDEKRLERASSRQTETPTTESEKNLSKGRRRLNFM